MAVATLVGGEIQTSPLAVMNLQELSRDYAEAKTAQKELVQTRKIVWLLLTLLKEPVVIDAATLSTIPDDFEIYEISHPCPGTITLEAK